MSKKKFLSELEERLSILEESERQDIINEYKDIIEEKVKNGKTVSEAITDFGDIDELAREILKAYKINPNYNKNEDTESRTWEQFENGIKKVAKKLANIVQPIIDNIKNNDNITVEKAFEILIKFGILMLLLLILKVPFQMFYQIGEKILDIGFSPLGEIILVIWQIIVYFMYIISCILIVFIFIQNELKQLGVDIKKKRRNKC